MSLEKKRNMPLAEKLALIDKIANDINEKNGKKIVGRIGADPDILDKLSIKFIPSNSSDFNRATGGGYPRSRCVVISGPEDSGKTSRVLEDIGYNMSIDPEFVACWIESEKSLEKNFVCETFHIDPDRFVFIEYEPERGAEGILDMLYGFMTAVKFDIVCINSLKCLVPKKILEDDFDQATPAVAARLNSLMVQKFTALVADSEASFILITHTYTSIGGYGSPQVISGGRAIRYWAALTMLFSKTKIDEKKDPIGKDEGVHIGVKVNKNHCTPDRNPYVQFDYFAMFGKGTEQYLSKMNAFCDAGIMENNKGNIKIFDTNGDEIWSTRGKNNYREYMINNPEFFKSLVERLENGGSTVKSMSDKEIDEAKKLEEEDKVASEELQSQVDVQGAQGTKPVKVAKKNTKKESKTKNKE